MQPREELRYIQPAEREEGTQAMTIPPVKRYRPLRDDVQQLLKDVEDRPGQKILAAYKITEEECHNAYRRLRRLKLKVITRKLPRPLDWKTGDPELYGVWVKKGDPKK